MRLVTRAACRRLLILFIVLDALVLVGSWWMTSMPGESWVGALPPFSDAETRTADRLRDDVEFLAGTIGPRHVLDPETLERCAAWIETTCEDLGYDVSRQVYDVIGPSGGDPVPCANVVAERAGDLAPAEIVVLGAHYDTVMGSPGANDNASGVAALLELARRLRDIEAPRTLRLVFFCNEEPPFFWTDQMGSLVYARECRARDDDVVAMLSLETLGWYSDEPGSQDYPPPASIAYPSTGNYVGFVGNMRARPLVREVVEAFRAETAFPSEGGAIYGGLPGIGWSDHWAFWQCGYPALMVTDTAKFRYPFYHTAQDTPDRLRYKRMARVVEGLERCVHRLLGAESRR